MNLPEFENALQGVVYDAPAEGYPALAVVFRSDGSVLVAHPVADRAEGEALMSSIMGSVQAQIDAIFGDSEDELEAVERLEGTLRAAG